MKMCPFLSAPTNTAVKCVGDACACWRVAPPTTPETGLQRVIIAANPAAECEDDAGPKPPEVSDGWIFFPDEGEGPAGWVEPVESAIKRQVGYCGLADSPLGGGA
jgi:hypothetical protein